MSKNTDLVLRGAENLFSSSELLTVQPEDLAPEEALFVWSLFDVLEKELVSKRKVVFREHLLGLAMKNGEKNAKGSFVYNPPHSDGRVTAQRRKGKVSVDQGAAERLVESKQLGGTLKTASLTSSLDVFSRITAILAVYEGSHETADILAALHALNFSVDEKKLEGAFTLGLITPDELKDISCEGDATFALTVKKPSSVTQLVQGRK